MSLSLATRSKIDGLKQRLSKVYERQRENTETVVEIGTEVVAGAAFGAADMRWGTAALMGASIPLVVGVVSTGAALAGYGGGAQGVLLSLGRAGLVVEAYRRGAEMYSEWDANRPGTDG